jgi:transcriptional regulator with XRE-family HTH domain
MSLISKRLKKFREELGFTQKQIADALNIERSTYAYYETGKTTPDINTIGKLLKIFNTTYSHLLEGSKEEPLLVFKDIKTSKNNDNPNTISDSPENLDITKLTKEEKQILIYFRLSSAEQKEEMKKNLRQDALDN